MIEIAVTVILLQASLYFRIGKLNITSARIVLNHFNDLWCNIAFKPFDGICPALSNIQPNDVGRCGVDFVLSEFVQIFVT